MKFCLLLAVVVAAMLHLAAGKEVCPVESCVGPTQCEHPIIGAACNNPGTICCSIVKEQFKTHCRHYGGVCMESCAINLQHQTVDCNGGTTCCVLV